MTNFAVYLLATLLSRCLLVRTEERCPGYGWEKIGQVKPESLATQTHLFAAIDSNGITKPCFERCEQTNCTAFVLDFARSVCYAVQTSDEELLPDANAILYRRICLKVPASCLRDRLWQVERNPGAVFIDSSAMNVPGWIARSRCYEKCMETDGGCESAQFRTTKPLSINDAFGRCSLSLHERGTRPRAYRVSMYRDEYLWDQCRNLSKREYCSYAEYRNATLPYSDLALPDLDADQCQSRCDRSTDGFVCRGYTVDTSSGRSICSLHSDDTNSLGVSSLIVAPNVIYREREPCLDLRVRCNESAMTIELRTGEAFFGRMYANGRHADTCGVQGIGRNRTVLTLPIPTADNIRRGKLRCGLSPAFPIDDRNRSKPLVWVTIVVQFNPVVQRLGDQAIRVGCSLNDRESPQPKNVTVQSSFSFLDPNAGVPPISSTIVNASTRAPSIAMRILDENSRDAVVTHLGQRLTLKIQLTPANGPYDISAGHLVASSASGDSSYLLLDANGCPTDPSTFPALSKDPLDGRSLTATFVAFKFPDSLLVRFDVRVRFCLEKCLPVNCEGMSSDRERRKRTSHEDTDGSFRVEALEELLLQLSIIVRNPVATMADRLSSRDLKNPDTVLFAEPGSLLNGLFCVNASLALSLLILWLIVQIALLVGCTFTVTRYKRMAVRAEEDRANVLTRHLYGVHGGNLDIARRVRWADRNPSASSLS